MKISMPELKRIANVFLEALDREKIVTTKDLEAHINKTLKLPENSQDSIAFSLRPSGSGTQTYTISYLRNGCGIPIELKINPVFRYTHVILKAHEEMTDYSFVAKDPFGNIVQSRILISSDFEVSRDELRKLAK